MRWRSMTVGVYSPGRVFFCQQASVPQGALACWRLPPGSRTQGHKPGHAQQSQRGSDRDGKTTRVIVGKVGKILLIFYAVVISITARGVTSSPGCSRMGDSSSSHQERTAWCTQRLATMFPLG